MTDAVDGNVEAGLSKGNTVDKQISVKKIGAALTVLVVLGGTFFAGMQYEDYRITKAIESAFSADSDGDSADDALDFDDESDSDEEDSVDAVELVKGQPLEVTLADGEGEMTVTLSKVALEKASGSNEEDADLTRNLIYTVKIENTGDSSIEPDLTGHFESEGGKVYDFAGVMCDNDIPYDEIDPGQFVEGCGTSDIPADKGKLMFDEDDTPFFIKVAAA